ncbi:uroporphyrinogen decarboxylase [Candidatus Pelagibacter communis]|uniref:uroporphyrinogen decarboxylase n=1 Tax=Pelagibacter ubique TaxID=198252 RepID=UPI00094D43CC|nr:uroporphyrinogen decarboxylase [Candidatus Pelagibacter ubique]
MSLIKKCIINKDVSYKPVWLMRQAGRYLPEFRAIRKKNQNFISLCLNTKLVPEITLQPIKRFDLDAAIIFSDILMIPYGFGQNVIFNKGLGPELGIFDKSNFSNINEKDFKKKLDPIYNSIKITSKNEILKNKDLIGFVGAPWTLLVYIINRASPKKNINKNFFNDQSLIDKLLRFLVKYIKIHILNQIKSGATIIQVFDSWAGLLEEEDLGKYIYAPTKEIIDFIRTLNVPSICFPRNIKNYKKFVTTVKPDVISIDYNVNPEKILEEIDIPVQGGLNPEKLLEDKATLKQEVKKYLKVFKNHPYIFNLGHGVLPETNPNMVEYLIKFIKDN